jgi:hypothetical protein
MLRKSDCHWNRRTGQQLKARSSLNIQLAREDTHILVAATGEIDYQYVMRSHPRRNPKALGDGVGGFERGQNAFRASQLYNGFEDMGIVG